MKKALGGCANDLLHSSTISDRSVGCHLDPLQQLPKHDPAIISLATAMDNVHGGSVLHTLVDGRAAAGGIVLAPERCAMRFFAALLALGLLLAGPQVSAQPAAAAEPAPSSTMVPEFLVLAQMGAERMVREVPVGLTNVQVWGIAVGIVAGAFVADLTGLNGLVTLAHAAAGGAAGNMVMSPVALEGMDDDLDDDL